MAAYGLHFPRDYCLVSTHSHPKVAAFIIRFRLKWLRFQHTATRRWLQARCSGMARCYEVSTHSHPKVAATTVAPLAEPCKWFQHTATRRWLHGTISIKLAPDYVSTHSHPKVAALHKVNQQEVKLFQHTATRRWLQRL